MDVTLTTFNLENLFNRYRLLDEPWENRSYEKMAQAVGLVSIASRAGDLVSYATSDIQRNNTAQAILDSAPDILAVQEVENLYTLRLFNDQYLDDYFDRQVLIDGNDPRGIDVGLMIRAGFKGEIVDIRTHVDEASKKGKSVTRGSSNAGYFASGALFSRDALEVDIRVGARTVTLLVNHLKAQDRGPTHVSRRKAQADRVAALAQAAITAGKYPVVLGDLNTDPQRTPADGSLTALLKKTGPLADPFPKTEWTHYYASGRKVSRLDYILPDKRLTVKSTRIVRNGLTTKCKDYAGARYSTIGQEHTEASDHCPVSVVLSV